MGGFLGIGGSSTKTDRGNQLSATQGNWNLFNWAMPTGQSQQATGQGTLGTALNTLGGAQGYWNSLLTAGRTQTAASAAPAINATLAGADATRAGAGSFGTGRTGGTAAINREAGANTQASIDNTINSTLQGGRAAGAQGLQSVAGLQAGIGSSQLNNAGQLLGLSASSIDAILNNATQSKETDPNIGGALGGALGSAYAKILFGG